MANLTTQIKSFFKAQGKARTKYFDLMYQAVEQYAANDDHAILNALISDLDGSGYESMTRDLIQRVGFHKFDMDTKRYTDIINPAVLKNGKTKREHVIKNWLDIYLEWQTHYTDKPQAERTERTPLELITTDLQKVMKRAPKLDNDAKMKLYLTLLDMAATLK